MKKVRTLLKFEHIQPEWLLPTGIVLMSMSHLSYSINAMAWSSMAPFLLYLSRTNGLRKRLYFILALIVAWSIIVLKIITEPIPFAFIFLYSIPISLIHLPGYLLWSKYGDRRGGTLVFPAIMVILEWCQYSFTPLGSWGAAAYTQVNTLPVMQILSIFGMAGLSFLVYWINAALANYLNRFSWSLSLHGLPITILLGVIAFGFIRLSNTNSSKTYSITVAAIGTDSEIMGLPLPARAENEEDIRQIFERTRTAAGQGAKIIAWNEAAFFLEKDYEARWIDAIQQLSKDLDIVLFASYIVPISESPFVFENKFLLVNDQGKLINTYFKHEPVPGEPAVKGFESLMVYNFNEVKLGGAICYDYDFPYLAEEYGELGADIVAVPSSDWQGIDPLHTQMAAFRAVEQGHSVLRSTRFGLSAAINPYGEMVDQMSSFDSKDKILIAHLPTSGITTIYSRLGDVFIYVCIISVAAFFIFLNPSVDRQAVLLKEMV